MSNMLAVATVTAALQDMLSEAAAKIPGAIVNTVRPGSPALGTNFVGINVYLYQVLPNLAWRNVDLELRHPEFAKQKKPDEAASPDDIFRFRTRRWPQTPLNLHYLLTFFGSETEYEPQRLLGAAVEMMGRSPRITLASIANAKKKVFLADTDLDFQIKLFEPVKLTPIGLSLEELSKLWSVFFQVPYALSLAYEASVVLIESPEIDTPLVQEPPRIFANKGSLDRSRINDNEPQGTAASIPLDIES